MKKNALLLAIIGLISCNNVTKKNPIAVDSTFEEVDEVVYEEVPEVTSPAEDEVEYAPETKEEIVTVESTPNTYPSDPSYSVGGSSNQSDERITGSYSNYSHYEETSNCVEGVVVYEGDDDYYIVETSLGYTVLEVYSGILYEGDKVRGELNKYNFKYLINRNRKKEVKVYIEDFMLSDDDAIEWLGEHDHLDDDDQEVYDANKQ